MKQVLILGNGKSRLQKYEDIKKWTDEIWVCNEGYQECKTFPNISLVASVHDFMILVFKAHRRNHNKSYEIVGPIDKDGYECYNKFIKYSGWSTGNELIQEAILRGYEKIVLAGFDMGGLDVYKGKIIMHGINFKRQFVILKEKYPNANIINM